ncbi:MAG: hypothetical protein U0Q16_36845 [Bryobacteraceae bacterium]
MQKPIREDDILSRALGALLEGGASHNGYPNPLDAITLPASRLSLGSTLANSESRLNRYFE